jgi:hypothetical protein
MYRLLLLLLFITSTAFAQSAPLRFQWQAGQVLTYKVSQTTNVTEKTIDEKAKKITQVITATKMTSTKKWTVKDVDANGQATLEMAVTAFRQEVSQTIGEAKPIERVVDSLNAEDTKTMPFLNKVILTVKIDRQGQLLDAKADNPATTQRLQIELPFRIVLPDEAPAKDAKWSRAIKIPLPPPIGTGEEYDATQQMTYLGVKDEASVIGFQTELKQEPSDVAMIPALAPMLWQGHLFFDAKLGRYKGAKLNSQKEVNNHRGENTLFKYNSEYVEVLEK